MICLNLDLVYWVIVYMNMSSSIMKLGKRACNPKMSNPIKLPCYFHNRPGKVHAANNDVAWKRKIGRNREV